ncbi:MAG: DUF72 domain-containing protein [Comamonadaceae bacterium]|nr:DUF72 domain-containing protein [Comamonadaceae bacterium]
MREFIEPALQGLGHKEGALVFQLSPLPRMLSNDLPALVERIGHLLAARPPLAPAAPDGVIALEMRDAAFLIPNHAPLLALWPGPLVCRWNLHRRHGAYGYESAKAQYAPFDRLQDPDPETRAHLARVITGTCGAGQNAYVTINNKAEGCSPLSVGELGKKVVN